MGLFYEQVIRRMLFKLDSEHAHEVGVEAMALLGRFTPICRVLEAVNSLPSSLYRPIEVFGLTFPNAIGLAAGFDKNGSA